MPAITLSLLVIAVLIALPATAIARAIGNRINALDAPGVAGQVKAPSRRVPNTGGPAILLAIVIPMLAGLWFFHGLDTSPGAEWRTDFSLVPADLEDYAAGIQQMTPSALKLLAGLVLLHIIGLIDDRRPLGPAIKLIVMLAVATGVVISTESRLLTLLDARAGGAWASVAITVIWIVVVTNAFNFLDNMDGLSGGVAAICAAFFLIAAMVSEQWFVAATLALIVGSLVGFLYHNFPWRKQGATIFMGDSGSLVVGFLIAVLSVRITYLPVKPGAAVMPPQSITAWLVLTPLIILAIPLYDFCSVCAIRISQGRSPFVGDLQHFSHRLVRHGLSKRAAVIVIYGCTALTGIGAIALPSLKPWQAVLVGVQTLLVLLVIALYEWSRAPSNERGT